MYVVQDAAKNRRLVKAKRPADALIQFRDSVPANVQTPPIRVYLAEEYLERPVPVLEQPENS